MSKHQTPDTTTETPTPTPTPLDNAAQFSADTSTDAEQLANGASDVMKVSGDETDGPLAAFSSIQFVPRLDAPVRDQKDSRTGQLTEKTRKVGEVYLELRGMPGAYLTGSITKIRKVGQVKSGIRASFVPFDFERKLSPVMSDTDEGKASEKATKDAIIMRFLKWADENGIDLSKPQAAPVQFAIDGDDLI